MTILGVLADTHIPDRARRLNTHVIPLFRRAGVAAILHAGDVSIPRTLDLLREVAPVYAVRGNRDWFALGYLPLQLELTFDGIVIGLTHGHGRWWNYFADKVDYIFKGYQLESYQPRLLEAFPQAQVIIFGHTHRPINQWVAGKLVFNPGSAHIRGEKEIAPSVGLLHIPAGEQVRGEILLLDD